MRVICVIPVELYDDQVKGIYSLDQEIEGPKARKLLEAHPEYFKAEVNPVQPTEPEEEKDEDA